MKRVNRVIFAADSGTSRAPMAMAIFSAMPMRRSVKSEARGIVVQFPEPMNQKAEAVLISNGLELKDYSSQPLSEEDFTEDTLVIVMESSQRAKVLAGFSASNEENTQMLNEIVGDELEIMDPYGAPIQSYGLCFETMRASIEKLVIMLDD